MINKKFLALLGALTLSFPCIGYSYSCFRCHKSEGDLASKIQNAGVKNENELVDFLKNKSSKKAIHKNLSDDEIKQAYSVAKKEPAKPAEKATKAEPAKPAEKAKPAQPAKKTKQTKKEANATHAEKAKPATPAEKAQPAQPKKKVEGC